MCFNPSCGLIGCGTRGRPETPSAPAQFQSLVRVDWLWNTKPIHAAFLTRLFQSLVRVDWLWNEDGRIILDMLGNVSIPRAG